MKGQRTEIWKKEEYSYEGAHGFIPVMVSYMHEDDKIHPAMIVVPGGGYRQVSRTEAHLVAIAVCGFSAGGHLCASLSVHWKDIKDPDPVYDRVSNRPDAAILAYPVITAGKAAHPGSFVALFGENPDQKDLDYMSLEKHVTADTPPCFLWQTATDESVPVENSYLFAKACKEAGVPYAHHVFSDGVHGMSVATEDWLEERGREPYTMEQIRLLGEAILRGETRFEKKTGEELLAKYGISRPAPEKWSRDEKEHLRKVLKEVGAWRMLAKCWLAAVWDV